MIENEIAKFEKLAPAALELLLVAQLGEPLLVAAIRVSVACSSGSSSGKGLIVRPYRRRTICAAGGRVKGQRATWIGSASAAGSRPASTCSVPRRCSAITRAARASSRRAEGREQAAVLGVGGGEHLGRMGDVGDQVGHRALHLGHRAGPAAGCRSPRPGRRASGCRPAR